MLIITDFGCDLHLRRKLKYFGSESLVLENVLANLPSEGDCHTYICEHGHTHRLLVDLRLSEALNEGEVSTPGYGKRLG